MEGCKSPYSGAKVKKLLTCRSLYRALERSGELPEQTVVLEIGLHVEPARLSAALAAKVEELDGEGVAILFGYGLCGRAVEGLSAKRSTLVIPRVDDCVGALMGSRKRHREFLSERAGTYFLAPEWLGTEVDLFSQFGERLVRIPPARREGLIRTALRNYSALALITDERGDEDAEKILHERAARFALEPLLLERDTGLLGRLLNGPWTPEEFVVTPPGGTVRLF